MLLMETVLLLSTAVLTVSANLATTELTALATFKLRNAPSLSTESFAVVTATVSPVLELVLVWMAGQVLTALFLLLTLVPTSPLVPLVSVTLPTFPRSTLPMFVLGALTATVLADVKMLRLSLADLTDNTLL